MRRLKDNLPDGTALVDIDLVEDLLLAWRRGGYGRALCQWVPHLVQLSLPAACRDGRRRGRPRRSYARGLEKVARGFILVGNLLDERPAGFFGQEGRNIVRPDL